MWHYQIMRIVRAVMIGDIVGCRGIEALEKTLPALIKERFIDFVIVNGENSADGFGMTEKDFRRIIASGADAVTSGNHIWEEREFWPVLEREKNMLRPENYPAGVPGRGLVYIEKNGIIWAIINLQGRELMNAIDCPFQCFDRCLTQIKNYINSKAEGKPVVVIVDFHAESSREKEALGYYADGRVSLIAGTHTHVQTADERLLPKGSAYITDLGMTGITESVIGMDPQICLERVRKQVLYHMEIAAGNKEARINGIIAEVDADTGTAVSIKRI